MTFVEIPGITETMSSSSGLEYRFLSRHGHHGGDGAISKSSPCRLMPQNPISVRLADLPSLEFATKFHHLPHQHYVFLPLSTMSASSSATRPKPAKEAQGGVALPPSPGTSICHLYIVRNTERRQRRSRANSTFPSP